MGEIVVTHEHHRIAEFVGEMKGKLHQPHGLRQVDRRQHDGSVIAVPAAASGLIIIPLPASHVEHNHGHTREAKFGD